MWKNQELIYCRIPTPVLQDTGLWLRVSQVQDISGFPDK